MYRKYHNTKITIGGNTFDSKKEAERFQLLKLLERAGKISDLQMQVKFLIVPKAGNNKRERFYIADFIYTENGKRIIEDVKSAATKKDKVYSLKKALMLYLYPEYEFREYD